MQVRKVRGFDAGRVFRFGLLVLGMWASSPIAGFAQGEASIQGLVSDASGGRSRVWPFESRIWIRERNAIY